MLIFQGTLESRRNICVTYSCTFSLAILYPRKNKEAKVDGRYVQQVQLAFE